MRGWIESLPRILAGADFTAVVAALIEARQGGRGVLWGRARRARRENGARPGTDRLDGGGLSSRRWRQGATVIHDFELAFSWLDVRRDVGDASVPAVWMWPQTAGQLIAAINDGVGLGLGLGQAVVIGSRPGRHGDLSILTAACRLQIPITVHVGVGTDIIHMHPAASGAAIEASRPSL